MAQFIPVFPLNLVAFPHEQLNLHVYEPRYKQLIKDCNLNNKPFGIPPVKDGIVVELGTLMKLKRIENTYEDGRMDIRVTGIRPFRILELRDNYYDKLYAGAEIEFLSNNETTDLSKITDIVNLIDKLYSIMNIKKTLPVV